MNNVVLIGRLTKDPELRYLPNADNRAVARFTLAVDKGLSRDKKAEFESKGRPTADFINCVIWGKPAETLAQYVSKGNQLAVQGKIQTGSFEAQDGTRRYTTDVLVDNFQFIDYSDRQNRPQGGYGQGQSYNQDNNNNFGSYNNSSNDDYRESSNDMSDIEGFYEVSDDDIPF